MTNITPPAGPALIHQDSGQIYPLGQEMVTIGRKSGNTIVLQTDDLKASRHHATISLEGGRYILRDVGSMNGTFLNDRRLSAPHSLTHGDIVGVGSSIFTVKIPQADTEPSLVPSPAVVSIDAVAPEIEADSTMVQVKRPDFLANPYVGPRTFTQPESDRFFGRELEARELLSLVISERLVLFYAQSGAGKSSLINTRLVPQLQKEGMSVLPVGRVSGELPESVEQVENIFLFNLLLSMDESDSDPNRFTQMSLTDFLIRLTSLDGIHYYYDENTADEPTPDDEYQETPYVLLIDQFEEIVTTHSGRWRDREGFFRQLAQAMENDPYLWVVLSLREDFVAALDPYAHLLPGNLRARFYMQRMGYPAALDAVKKPAEQFGRTFAPGVAESLVDNLRQIRVYSGGTGKQVATSPGQFVEPVQLQVVCYQLWENLIGRPAGEITRQDLQELGDVDRALAQFYEQAVEDAVSGTSVPEVELRLWFESKLITEAGTKGLVYRGKTQTGGVDNHAVDLLVNKFLLRSEGRGGGTWYELVHDRFIEPIQQSNQTWRLKLPVIQVAQDWADSGRPDSGLLEGQTLREVQATNWEALGPLVKEYIEASELAEQARKELEVKKIQETNARLRSRAVWMTVFATLALCMALAAGWFALNVQRSQAIAQDRADAAETSQAQAIGAQATAEKAQVTAETAKGTAEAESTRSAESKATAEAESTISAAAFEAAAANAAEARRLLEIQQATQTAEASLNITENKATATWVAFLQVTLTVAAATLDAPTLTPTFTPTIPPATATPTGTFIPPYTATPTSTPTPTLSPTPNKAATALVDDINRQLSEIVQCKIEPVGDFVEVWSKYKDELGCPLYAEPLGGYFAEQPFQNGYMFWSSILDEFFVVAGDDSGNWLRLTKADVDEYNLNPDGPACKSPVPVPDGYYQPIRGFGAVWCGEPEIAEALGFATQEEFGTGETLMQEFENGIILRDSLKQTYILFSDTGKYIRKKL